uniref:Putative signal peptidase complex subunit 2 n=1 Tax=Rhizophora mucronata TaxID=61149 RepID=A0A2P2IR54_RHIMU
MVMIIVPINNLKLLSLTSSTNPRPVTTSVTNSSSMCLIEW